MQAWIKTKDELWLICDEKSLSKDLPNIVTRYKLNTPEDVCINVGTADTDGEVTWDLQIGNESFQFICKEDYHLRDFLNAKNNV